MGKLQQTIIFFLIILFSILYFGEIIKFNFSLDDFTILYYAKQHVLLFYPYYGMSFIFEPLYSLFGLDSVYYYLISFILFVCNALGIYFFTNLIFKNKRISISASLFFIVLFVGSDAMYSMSEGIRINIFLLLQTSTLFLFSSHALFDKKRDLITGVFLAIILVLVFPYRAHPLLAYILLIELFLSKKKPNVLYLVKTLIPIAIAYILAYSVIPHLTIFKNQEHRLPLLFYNFNFEAFKNTYITTKNMITPPQTMFNILKYVVNINQFFFFAFILLLIIFLRDKRIILISLLLLLSILSFTTLFGVSYVTYDRYLFVSRVFFSILLSVILWKALESNLSKFFKFLVTALFLILIVSHLKQGVAYKSEVSSDLIYSKQVFNVFKKEVKVLPEYSIFFLDGKDVPTINKLSRIAQVGVLTHGGSIAIYFDRDYEKVEVVFSCDATSTILKRWKNKKVGIYYFFDSGNSLKLLSKAKLSKKCSL